MRLGLLYGDERNLTFATVEGKFDLFRAQELPFTFFATRWLTYKKKNSIGDVVWLEFGSQRRYLIYV